MRPQIGSLVACDAGQVHVREDGPADGPAIVLVHGFASSMHTFDLVTPLLSDGNRVIRIDLLGHGCTGGSTGLDAPSQAHMVVSVLDTLAVTGVTAVGHSYGADVVLAAAERSGRIGRVVIVAQAPDYSYATLPRGGALMALPLLGPLLHRLSTPPLVRLAGRFAFAPGYDVIATAGGRDRAYHDNKAMTPAMYRTVLTERRKRLAARPLDVQVRDLGLPALLIAGRHDQLYDCAQTVARYQAAGAHVAVVEDSGHSPIIERPEETAKLLLGFVSDPGFRAASDI